jgi:hypothetical protein
MLTPCRQRSSIKNTEFRCPETKLKFSNDYTRKSFLKLVPVDFIKRYVKIQVSGTEHKIILLQILKLYKFIGNSDILYQDYLVFHFPYHPYVLIYTKNCWVADI